MKKFNFFFSVDLINDNIFEITTDFFNTNFSVKYFSATLQYGGPLLLLDTL